MGIPGAVVLNRGCSSVGRASDSNTGLSEDRRFESCQPQGNLSPSSSLSEKKKFFFMLLSVDIALFCYFDRRSRKPRLKII